MTVVGKCVCVCLFCVYERARDCMCECVREWMGGVCVCVCVGIPLIALCVQVRERSAVQEGVNDPDVSVDFKLEDAAVRCYSCECVRVFVCSMCMKIGRNMCVCFLVLTWSLTVCVCVAVCFLRVVTSSWL